MVFRQLIATFLGALFLPLYLALSSLAVQAESICWIDLSDKKEGAKLVFTAMRSTSDVFFGEKSASNDKLIQKLSQGSLDQATSALYNKYKKGNCLTPALYALKQSAAEQVKKGSPYQRMFDLGLLEKKLMLKYLLEKKKDESEIIRLLLAAEHSEYYKLEEEVKQKTMISPLILKSLHDLQGLIHPDLEHYVINTPKSRLEFEKEYNSIDCFHVVREPRLKGEDEPVKFHFLTTYETIVSWLKIENWSNPFFMPVIHDYSDEKISYTFQYCVIKTKGMNLKKNINKVKSLVYYLPGLSSGAYSFFELDPFRQIRTKLALEHRQDVVWVSFAFSSTVSFSERGVMDRLHKEIIPHVEKSMFSEEGESRELPPSIKRATMGASLGGGNVATYASFYPHFFDKAVALGGNVVDFDLFDTANVKKEPVIANEEDFDSMSYYDTDIMPDVVAEYENLQALGKTVLSFLDTWTPFITIAKPYSTPEAQAKMDEYIEKSGGKSFWVNLTLWMARKRIKNEEDFKKSNPLTLTEQMSADEGKKKDRVNTKFFYSAGIKDELGFYYGMKKHCFLLREKGFDCEFDEVSSYLHKYDPSVDPIFFPMLERNGHLVVNIKKIHDFLF